MNQALLAFHQLKVLIHIALATFMSLALIHSELLNLKAFASIVAPEK